MAFKTYIPERGTPIASPLVTINNAVQPSKDDKRKRGEQDER